MERLFVAGLLLIASCGKEEEEEKESVLTEKEFQDKAGPLLCAKFEECVDGFDAAACNIAEPADTSDCDFDPDAASACLEGIPSSACGTEEEFYMPTLPVACANVYSCSSGDDDDDTANDTGTDWYPCEAGDAFEAMDGTSHTLAIDGLQLVSVTPNLSATGFQEFEAHTCDWTYDSLLNIFQTDVDDLKNGWDEEHLIPTAAFREGNGTQHRADFLALGIDHVDTIGELIGDDTTLFNTKDAGALTFAMRVYDAQGVLADCIAWGHDVPGMLAGEVPANNAKGPSSLGEISAVNCADLSR